MQFDKGLQGKFEQASGPDLGQDQRGAHLQGLENQIATALKTMNEGLKAKNISIQAIDIPSDLSGNKRNDIINSWSGFGDGKTVGITFVSRFVSGQAVISVDLLAKPQTGWGAKSVFKDLDPAKIREAITTHAPTFEFSEGIGKPGKSGVAHKEYDSISFELREKSA
jgi:hypothetical protein